MWWCCDSDTHACMRISRHSSSVTHAATMGVLLLCACPPPPALLSLLHSSAAVAAPSCMFAVCAIDCEGPDALCSESHLVHPRLYVCVQIRAAGRRLLRAAPLMWHAHRLGRARQRACMPVHACARLRKCCEWSPVAKEAASHTRVLCCCSACICCNPVPAAGIAVSRLLVQETTHATGRPRVGGSSTQHGCAHLQPQLDIARHTHAHINAH